MQAVSLLPGARVDGWPSGIVVGWKWLELGQFSNGDSRPVQWTYKVQTDNADEIYDLWVPECDLQAR